MSEIKSKTGTALITGSGSKVGVESAALKWTVSLTQPPNPSPGDLWVKGDPNKIKVEKVIHLQTNKKTIDSPAANTIYILIPAEGYPLAETPVSIRYFENEKYRLQVFTPYILVTGNSMETLEIVRGVYTGTEWKMWGVIPDKPSEWEFLQSIAADTTWTPPNPGQWYRVHVFGKCGDGGKDLKTTRAGSFSEYGYAGGNTGGYACSIIRIEDSVPCTINGSVTSFGTYLSATSGGSGTNLPNTEGGYGNRYGTYANPSDVVGTATGGTEYNIDGTKAEAGGAGSGTSSGSDRYFLGGIGGKGARFTLPENGWPYIDVTTQFAAGTGSYMDSDDNGRRGVNAKPYPTFNISEPMLYGGGQGAGGVGLYNSWYKGGAGSTGSPGVIIIEKGKGV